MGAGVLYLTVFVTTLQSQSSHTDPLNQPQPGQHLPQSVTPNVVYRRSGSGKPSVFCLGIFLRMQDVHRRRLIRETILGKSLPKDVQNSICTLQEYEASLSSGKSKNRDNITAITGTTNSTTATTTTTGKDATTTEKSSSSSSSFSSESNGNRKTCRIVYTFVVGGNAAAPPEWTPSTPSSLSSSSLSSPQTDSNNNGMDSTNGMTLDPSNMLKHEHDITYLNIRENMNDGKTPTWFHYASSYIPGVDYIGKADSDTLLNIPALLSFLDRDGNHPRRDRVYGGHLQEYDACGGAGPICEKLRGKVYMSGQFYWLSKDLAEYVSSSAVRSRRFQRTNNEDLDLGLKVLSYPEPIHLMTCNGAQFWIHPLKKEEEWLEAFREKLVDRWYSMGTDTWKDLYEPEPQEHRSIMGTIQDLDKMPILLD